MNKKSKLFYNSTQSPSIPIQVENIKNFNIKDSEHRTSQNERIWRIEIRDLIKNKNDKKLEEVQQNVHQLAKLFLKKYF